MVANRVQYGFRWVGSKGGSNNYSPKLARIASGYQGAVNGVADTTLALRKGDPIHALSTGYFQLCAGNEAAGNAAETVDGIIVGIEQYWDGEKLIRAGTRVPYNTTYSGRERETRVWYIPSDAGLFEVDVDDAATATTYAAYLALRGELCDHRLKSLSETDGKAWPRLDISTHVAPASSAQWKIEDISRFNNNIDFAGANVKLIVSVYEGAVGV